ncbi:hypothetical protein SDC9_150509 [bioreactor metagenome]|uniref:Uncharacterized protein n=1 Tax=bioreactor metagenome TaxID=1076179 RepID=A0A645EPT5_9ZZZZ
MAVRLGNESLLLQFIPGNIESLGSHKAEDLVFPPVLTHQCGGESYPVDSLQFCSDLEDRGWKHMHLIIDDESPVALGQKIKMREWALLVRSVGEHLVGADGDLSWVLALTGILSDLLFLQVGLVQNFLHPLVYRCNVGGYHQCPGSQSLHDLHAHHRLSRPTGKHNGPETATWTQIAQQGICCHLLVRPYDKVLA